jgi:hypothetical protein
VFAQALGRASRGKEVALSSKAVQVREERQRKRNMKEDDNLA